MTKTEDCKHPLFDKPQNSSDDIKYFDAVAESTLWNFKQGKLAGMKEAYDLTKKIHHKVHGDDCRCNWESVTLQSQIETALEEEIAQLEKDLE